jgi:hypothetical protein
MEKVKTMDANEVIQEAESIIEQRRQEAAARMGVEASKVEARRLELAKMREAGLLLDIDVTGISMFSARNTYAELGISADDVRAKRLRAGRRDLFPEHTKRFRSLEARARQNVERHSFQVAAFGQWKWVPWSAYEAFVTTHNEILAELEEVKAHCLAHYDETRENNRVYFEQVAERAWTALLSKYAPGDRVMVQTVGGKSFDSLEDHDAFIEYVVQRALAKMPLPEEIENLVCIDYRTSILYTESELAAEQAAVAEAKAAEAEAREREAEAKQKAYQHQLDEWTAENEAKAKIAAFKKAEMERAREQLAAMASPLDEALDGLRANIYDAVKSLLAGLQKNDGFRGMASKKAAGLLAYWKQLNGGLLQDDDLEAALEDLDSQMKVYATSGRAVKNLQIGDIAAQLDEIAMLTVESARKIAKQGGSRASALEL